MSTEANMSTESVVMQTIELPKGSMILGTSNRYHGDGSVSVDVHYSVPKDSAEQTLEPPVSAIVIRDGKPRHNREEAPLKWLDTDEEIVRAIIDDDFARPQQFYRVLPVYFTAEEWRSMFLYLAERDDVDETIADKIDLIINEIRDAARVA